MMIHLWLQQLGSIDAKFEVKFVEVEKRFDKVEVRVDKLEAKRRQKLTTFVSTPSLISLISLSERL
jgi:hypothetical protein